MLKAIGNFSIFGLFTIGLLIFIGYSAIKTWHQYQSASYQAVEGTIAYSSVTISHSSKGRTYYHWEVDYNYQAGDKQFTGDRYRFELDPTGQNWANAMVRTHPYGSKITVYYDPSDPSLSVLSPGITGMDFSMYFMLIGLLAFLILNLARTLEPAWTNYKKLPAGGVRIISTGLRTRMRLPRYSAASWAVLAFSIASFAGFFALLFMNSAYNVRTLQPVGMTALAVFGVGAVIYLWRWLRLQSGADDLVIDENARNVTLPRTFGRHRTLKLDFTAVESVDVGAIPHRTRYGIRYTWAVTLAVRGEAGTPEKLADWSGKEKSEALAAWLRERLHLSTVAPVLQPD